MDYDKIEREIVISAPVDRVRAVITAPEHWLGEGDPAGFDLREGTRIVFQAPAGMTPARFEEVFVALADATRRQVLDRLAAHGEATATMLAAELPVSRQAIVKHLNVLERAGLVVGSRAGREVRYTLRSQPLDATARWMAGLAAEWDARLAEI
jgi:DNA-binding transcriptional ArsR family regulator